MTGIAVEVNGIPNILPDDRMVDKLTIHFLRPRNAGGEVNRVLFPSDCSGQAFVIFEEPEVAARVLRSSHVLELEERKFPLSLKAADTPEVDLPVEASLDMQMFPNPREVLRLIKSHSLKVTESRQDQLRVQGSFLQLRAVKSQLQQLLHQDTPPQNHPSSLNGHSQLPGAITKSTSRMHYESTSRMHYDTSSSSMHGGSRSPMVGGGQALFGLPSSPNPSPQASGFSYSTPSPPGYGASPAPRGLASPRSATEVSFMTDPDVLRYAQAFKKKDIDLILENHNTNMNVKRSEDADVSQVILEGRKCHTAMEKLQGLLTELTTTLRTQEIPLASLDHDSQVKVGKRIQEYMSKFPSVLIDQVGHTVRLVGPSKDSYELKQKVLGKVTDQPPAGHRGRPAERERGSKERRSMSLPRRLKGKDGDSRGVDLDPISNSAHRSYSPSKYQGDVASAGAVQGAGVRDPLPAIARSSTRTRSSSESRAKVREQRGQGAAPRQGMEEQAPSGGHKSPPEKKQSLTQWLNSSTTEIKEKLKRRGKK